MQENSSTMYTNMSPYLEDKKYITLVSIAIIKYIQINTIQNKLQYNRKNYQD